jgi:hypothetical protein
MDRQPILLIYQRLVQVGQQIIPFLGFGILVMEILQLNKIQFTHTAMDYMPHV